MDIKRRKFIGASLGLGYMAAQSLLGQQSTANQPPGRMTFPIKSPSTLPSRKGKITPLFKSPEGYPNGMALAPNGWWLGEQKTEHAILIDWDGKLLTTVKSESKNTSGIAFGDGYIWMAANSAATEGIFQTDMNSKTVRHLQIPLGGEDGGGCHGLQYQNGKLWIAALRLRGILRVDAKTWEPEFLIPYAVPRAHGIAWDNGTIWMVTGSAEGKSGLIRYDASTGRPLETVEFDDLYPDPHGLAMRDGVMYTCDAGLHPGWVDDISAAHGYVCRIDF